MSRRASSHLEHIATLLVLAICACSSAVAQQPKRTIVQDSYWIEPETLDTLWDSSTIIAKVVVERSEPLAVAKSQGPPAAYTRHYARIVHVFKGDTRQSQIVFAQGGGTVETPDYIVRSGEARLLETGRQYVVFLKPWPQVAGLILDYNHYGAFEIRESRVVPLAGGAVSNQWRDISESRFADALNRLRIRRGYSK